MLAMRSTARRAIACEQEAAELEARLDRLVRQIAPHLLDQLGIGPVVAGQVISSWSHHGRVRCEAAFAKLGGVAPIETSSETVVRPRLTGLEIDSSTGHSARSCSSECAKTLPRRPTFNVASPRARPSATSRDV